MQDFPPGQPPSMPQEERRPFSPLSPTPYQSQPAQPFPAPPIPQSGPVPYYVPPVPGTPPYPGAFSPPPLPQGAPPPLSPQAQKYLRTIPTFQNILQRELNLPSPLPYWIEDAHAPQLNAGNVIGDTLSAYFGGSTLTHIFTVHFKLPWPDVAEVHVRLNRHAGAYYPILLYTATLRRPVSGEVLLEPSKLLSWPKFIGNPMLCQRLNNATPLLRTLDKFARTEETYAGRRKIKISRFVRLGPLSPSQSHLAIRALPASAFSLVGTNYHFNAPQFLSIAATIESMLA